MQTCKSGFKVWGRYRQVWFAEMRETSQPRISVLTSVVIRVALVARLRIAVQRALGFRLSNGALIREVLAPVWLAAEGCEHVDWFRADLVSRVDRRYEGGENVIDDSLVENATENGATLNETS